MITYSHRGRGRKKEIKRKRVEAGGGGGCLPVIVSNMAHLIPTIKVEMSV